MFHLVASARPRTLLFRTHAEAAALFAIVARTFPELVALCLMPDHLHLLLPHSDPGERLGAAMSAYARWRNARRRDSGPVFAPAPPAVALPNEEHARRTVRYIHLNPCRAGLATDPLAWPWSTHRDAVGLAARPIRPRHRDPESFHAYVSGDPSVHVASTPLPTTPWGDFTWADARDAASALTRAPLDALLARGPARTLALLTAWYHGPRDANILAAHAGMLPNAVRRATTAVSARGAPLTDPALAACVRVVGDPRFSPLHEGDLLRVLTWARYRALR